MSPHFGTITSRESSLKRSSALASSPFMSVDHWCDLSSCSRTRVLHWPYHWEYIFCGYSVCSHRLGQSQSLLYRKVLYLREGTSRRVKVLQDHMLVFSTPHFAYFLPVMLSINFQVAPCLLISPASSTCCIVVSSGTVSLCVRLQILVIGIALVLMISGEGVFDIFHCAFYTWIR